MSRTETIVDLARTIAKLRKWGERWKEAAEAAQGASGHLRTGLDDATREVETLRKKLNETSAELVKRAEADRLRLLDAQNEVLRLRALVAVITNERDQLRAKLEAATVAVQHTVPAAVPRKDVLGKTVRHSTGRVGVVTGVSTEMVDGAHWTLYTVKVKLTNDITGWQRWHASNCTVVDAEGSTP